MEFFWQAYVVPDMFLLTKCLRIALGYSAHSFYIFCLYVFYPYRFVAETMETAEPILASQEQPPEKPCAIPQSGTFDFEPTYTGNVGNDMGISTMGYRSAKYNPPEWHESNYSKYYQSFADRDNAEKVRHLSKETMKETEATTNKTQEASTKKLAERLKDINFWQFELEREINDVIAETELLLAQKKRLENGLRATEIPLHIATDNLNCRQRRQGIDLVQDDVELNLLKVSFS